MKKKKIEQNKLGGGLDVLKARAADAVAHIEKVLGPGDKCCHSSKA